MGFFLRHLPIGVRLPPLYCQCHFCVSYILALSRNLVHLVHDIVKLLLIPFQCIKFCFFVSTFLHLVHLNVKKLILIPF